MSRCLPFPPPNYMKNGIGGEALLRQLEVSLHFLFKNILRLLKKTILMLSSVKLCEKSVLIIGRKKHGH